MTDLLSAKSQYDSCSLLLCRLVRVISYFVGNPIDRFSGIGAQIFCYIFI